MCAICLSHFLFNCGKTTMTRIQKVISEISHWWRNNKGVEFQKWIELTHHSELCKSGRICSLTPSTWLVVFLPQISDRLSSHKCLWLIQSRLSLQRPHHTPKHYELPSLDVQTSSARDIPIQRNPKCQCCKMFDSTLFITILSYVGLRYQSDSPICKPNQDQVSNLQ